MLLFFSFLLSVPLYIPPPPQTPNPTDQTCSARNLTFSLLSLDAWIQQEQGAGEETSRLKEIYNSRISGLQRQLEEEMEEREALEQEAKEEVAKAVEAEREKHEVLIAKMKVCPAAAGQGSATCNRSCFCQQLRRPAPSDAP